MPTERPPTTKAAPVSISPCSAGGPSINHVAMNNRHHHVRHWAAVGLVGLAIALARMAEGANTASSVQPGFPAQAAVDGDRFAYTHSHAWAGAAREPCWWWQIEFAEPRSVGAILQIVGDHEFVLHNAPKSYAWEISDDGQSWRPLVGAPRPMSGGCTACIACRCGTRPIHPLEHSSSARRFPAGARSRILGGAASQNPLSGLDRGGQCDAR